MKMKSFLLKTFICASAFLLFAANNAKAELRTSISQYGITWTFSTARECGQFVTGDWWVVGPVTINSVSPAPANRMNGSVVNPKNENCMQGYDGRYTPNPAYPDALYNASLRASFPLTLSGVNSLVSTASNTGGQNCTYSGTIMGWMNEIGDCQRGYLKSMAVLTVVDAPVSAGTFRPSYIGGTNKEFINISQIDYNVLPNLPAPANLPDINRVLRLFERPWLDHFGCWITQFIHAIDNAEGYGREMSNDVSEAAAYLMTNGAQRDELARRMIQRGIDIYGGLMNGAIWPADGGHASGRKWPVLFAGKLLNHQGMLNIGTTHVAKFGEDLQTYYRSGPSDPWWRFAPGREDYRPQYRTCCTSLTWVGQALTARMLHLDDEWNHDVYFEYVDRWIAEGGGYGGNDGGGFISGLWASYRNNLPAEIPHNGGGPADTEAPSVPQNLAVTGTGLSSISLSWGASTDNVAVSGYKIYADGVYTQSVGSTSATISGLAPATTYAVTVSAYDAAGNESSQSSPAYGTTEDGSVVVISSATASSYEAGTSYTADKTIDGDLGTRWSALGDGEWLQLQLSGSANVTAVGIAFYNGDVRTSDFDIQVSSDGSNWTTVLTGGQSSGATTQIETFDVTNAEGSYVRYIGHGNSVNDWNSILEVEVYATGSVEPDTEAPSVPSGLVSSNITDICVDLSWNASTDNVGVTGYKVYTNGSNPVTVVGTSATICGLTPETQYSFTVSAMDAAGNESAQSSSVQAITVEFIGVISSTTWQSFTESTQVGEFTATFTAIPNGNNIDVLTGLQNGSASAYGDMACIIRFNTSGNIDARNGGTYTATNTVSYSSEISYAFRIEVNVPAHTYSVYVTPAGGSEQTVASNFAFRTEQASVTQITGWTVYGYQGTHTVDDMTFIGEVTDTEAPSVPASLTAGIITDDCVTLYWGNSTDNVGVLGYKAYIEGNNPVTTNENSITICGLEPCTQYTFTVSSFDAAGNESAQSSAIIVTTECPAEDTEAPSKPTGLTQVDATTSTISLDWNASTDNVGVIGYNVYTDGANPTFVNIVGTTIHDLTIGTAYTFTVSAIDAAGNESELSDELIASTGEIGGEYTSSQAWQSFQESGQTGTFTFTFYGVPMGDNIDALTGVQNGVASAYSDLACIIRFNTSGYIDARNGNVYTATNAVSYSAFTRYDFRVEIDVPSHTYSVYVTPQQGSEQTVASNFAFRTEQAGVTQLTGWSIYAYQGFHYVGSIAFGSAPDTESPSVPAGLTSSNVTTNSVDLSWSASTDNVGVTGYKVYTNGSNPVTIGGTSTTVSGLSVETQYSFTVSAIDAASNESAQSAAEVVTTLAPPSGIDLITNGEFDNGTTGWVAGNYGGTAALTAVTGQGMSGTNAMQISISDAGSNSWDIQIYQDVAIESGKTYEISFMSKAAASRTMAAVVQNTESPYNEYWHQDVNLNTSTQTFGPYTFNCSTTDATSRFKFFVAGNASTIYVDDIEMLDVSQSSAIISEAQNIMPSFNIYPNPLNRDVLTMTVYGYNSDIVNVTIYDMMGRSVYNRIYSIADQAELQIPANKLSKGIYVISVHGKEIVKQQKLIVE